MPTSAKVNHSGGFWRRNLDKIGIGGSVFAALCCLGFPALLSILSAIGLGFIVTNAVLIPLLLAFLAVTLTGLYLGTRHHHEPWALVLGALSAVLTFVAIGVVSNGTLAGIGIAGLVVASFLNVWFRSRQLRLNSTGVTTACTGVQTKDRSARRRGRLLEPLPALQGIRLRGR